MTIINGKVYNGNSVSISNGRVIIDGVDVTDKHEDQKIINITVEGDAGDLDVGTCNKLIIKGNVTGNVESGSADINCGNVGGNVRTGSGDVKAKSISGSVKTGSGDISRSLF